MQAIFEKKEYFQLSARQVGSFKGYLPMFHPHGELIYIIDGAVPITVDGKSHLLRAGEMAVLFPYLTHAYEDSPGTSAVVVLFDPRETAFDNTLLSYKPECCHTQAAFLAPLMARIVEMTKRNRPKTAMSYVNAVLGELLELLTLVPHDGPSGDMTVQVLSYCAEHFTEDITVSSLAAALYISESYVSKLFSRHLGCSFREHINALRIHKAQNLLETTALPISTVMTRCGFQNQSTFNRTFRDITGLSPRQFRNGGCCI